MVLALRQTLKLSQQLVMTPQLQQAIKLLQLNRLELVSMVQQELEENPVLEELNEADEDPRSVDTEDSPAEGADGDSGGDPSEVESGDASADFSPEGGEAMSLDAEGGEPSPSDDREPTDLEKVADVDWDNYIDSYSQTGPREGGNDDRPSFEANLTRRETLSEHLDWQLHLASFTPDEESIASLVIGNLDERGYLQASIEDLARQGGVGAEAVEAVVLKVQDFDPAGVAARDLRECLIIQARSIGIEDPLVLAILDQHLDRLVKRDFRGVARDLGVTVGEIADASKVIGTLDPRPGRDFGGDETVNIVPDIYVHKVGDEFHVVLNDDGLPRLRINKLYREVLARGRDVEKDTKDYVNEKVRSAMWLIKSIHQRQRTIYKVMQSILKQQREFFERGINHLKPLNLRDVADDIEMHESTVSRVTTNKYAHTPQGIFELKYFFNSSIHRTDGGSVASESVKERILKLIKAEDPARPLSDQRIAEMLRVANINIARRTVTKYRESLNLLSSTKRRQVG
jgi:RNA polymerase sigma-54 factor